MFCLVLLGSRLFHPTDHPRKSNRETPGPLAHGSESERIVKAALVRDLLENRGWAFVSGLELVLLRWNCDDHWSPALGRVCTIPWTCLFTHFQLNWPCSISHLTCSDHSIQFCLAHMFFRPACQWMRTSHYEFRENVICDHRWLYLMRAICSPRKKFVLFPCLPWAWILLFNRLIKNLGSFWNFCYLRCRKLLIEFG